jgi:hypothetical protein
VSLGIGATGGGDATWHSSGPVGLDPSWLTGNRRGGTGDHLGEVRVGREGDIGMGNVDHRVLTLESLCVVEWWKGGLEC